VAPSLARRHGGATVADPDARGCGATVAGAYCDSG
jgi:hypothetical protein